MSVSANKFSTQDLSELHKNGVHFVLCRAKDQGQKKAKSALVTGWQKRAAGLQLELDLGIHYAPAIVRDHGLRDAPLRPLVAEVKGQSFRVHARDAWNYSSLELRSWEQLAFDGLRLRRARKGAGGAG